MAVVKRVVVLLGVMLLLSSVVAPMIRGEPVQDPRVFSASTASQGIGPGKTLIDVSMPYLLELRKAALVPLSEPLTLLVFGGALVFLARAVGRSRTRSHESRPLDRLSPVRRGTFVSLQSPAGEPGPIAVQASSAVDGA